MRALRPLVGYYSVYGRCGGNHRPWSPPRGFHHMSSHAKDIYGGNYPKAKRLAIARSGGKCQFCGLRKASEGHHWAWPDYPSGEEVQGHDITGLCETCHELATMLRDWVERKHADFDQISEEIKASNNFYEKREAFSYWLFPEEDEEEAIYDCYPYSHTLPDNPVSSSGWTPEPVEFQPVGVPSHSPYTRVFARAEASGSVEDQLYVYQLQLDLYKECRSALERQMERLNKGERLDSRAALKDAKVIFQENYLQSNASWEELNSEYKGIGQEMSEIITDMNRLRKSKKREFNACSYYLILVLAGGFLLLVMSLLRG